VARPAGSSGTRLASLTVSRVAALVVVSPITSISWLSRCFVDRVGTGAGNALWVASQTLPKLLTAGSEAVLLCLFVLSGLRNALSGP
jgi:hypothetical protein